MGFEHVWDIINTDGFPPRWNCGSVWKSEPWWGWIHIASDSVIWLCYFAIPIILIAFTRRKKDIAFPRVVIIFALFILLCGATHLIDAMIFYWPAYRLAGLLKMATAAISFATVIALIKVTPKAMLLRGPVQAEREINERTLELRSVTEQLRVEVEDKKRALGELRDKQEMLKLALHDGDIGFFNWDLKSDEVIFEFAESKITGLGLTSGKCKPTDFFECIESNYRSQVEQSVQAAIRSQSQYDMRFPFLRPDGKRVWLTGRGRILLDDSGQPQKFIGLNQDVTEQVQREQSLDTIASSARSASQQKSRFIAQVSHEIRTPLAAMLGCLDSILQTVERGDLRETLSIVRSQGELLQVLVNDVIDLSKIEAGKLSYEPKPMEVANVFADICSLMNPLADEKGLVLRWLPESKLPTTIVCDRNRLKQVFVNLIGNAIKFTDRGTITIVPRVDWSESQNCDLKIEVRDTGSGIPKDKLDIVFEEFEQASDERSGAGLGLAICKRLVQMMGGGISVRSEVGIGSAFTVKIPLGTIKPDQFVAIDSVVSQVDDNPPLERLIEQKLKLRVLAAEDTRAIQFVLRRMIGAIVQDLTIVSNGKQAVEQVMEAERSDRPYDLVLMDIQMPEVDGIEATRQLRREGFTKPIIALTAGAIDSDRQACLVAGCTHFLAKPIDLRELKRLMQSIA
jgi:PAS domain S-box-containing protein